MTLSDRRATILRLIVSDYIDHHQPIGSAALVERHGLKMSSATIRNEMARLEEEGYISHPHTSAGRVPSDRGYRYFVEALMGEPELSPSERLRILHQFHQATSQVAEWFQLAATVLAQTVNNAAVVTAPRTSQTRLKHVQLVALHEHTALMVVVTQDVKVRQQVITFADATNQEELTRLSNRMNSRWAGLDAPGVHAQMDDLTPDKEQTVGLLLAEILDEEDEAAFNDARVEGVRNVLDQPEFQTSSKAAIEVLEALDEHNLSKAIPVAPAGDESVTVIIGSEHREGAMRDLSVVLTGYGPAGGPQGMLAVIGPTRMRYGHSIATVRYMSDVMSELLNRLYGANEDET